MEFSKLGAYELISEETIREVDSKGYLLKHKKTGARIAVLENEDDNKVFDIGFRTPPTDSTGIPHIVEHTVLCGSRKFPVKDPFAELDKGSLNTFLNAMTYPDKTVYPVASVNDKDFKNLMDVYLDAVFFPNIYKEEKIFRQEGWHYELDDIDGELIYNGVVFNEMKGAFSSPDEYFDNLIQTSLFPDNAYGVVSGGDPRVIPELKWEDYLDFHRRYYHPSNSYIYLYGKMDFAERLTFIDEEYLSKFDHLDVDSEIKLQEPFEQMRVEEGFYPVGADEGTEGKTYFAYSGVCADTLDPYLYQAFQMLEHALVEGVGAPVKEALVGAGIGTEVDGTYSEPFRQPFFTISTKNAKDDQKEEFLRVIRQTLEDQANGGLNKTTLKAALNAMEFQFREADFGRFPKGLMYGLAIYDSWLYDDEKPFIHLHVNDTFSYLREKINSDYFENLIRKYFLDNPHSSFVTLRPKPGMATEIDNAEREKLKTHLNSLSDDEKNEIIRKTKELKKYQEEPSTPEELATIPVLGREDIGKKARPITVSDRSLLGCRVVYNDIFTNGIAYIRLSFDVSDLKEYAGYVSLLSELLGVMDTDRHDKLELSNEMLLHAGGYSLNVGSVMREDTREFGVRWDMSIKLLYHEIGYVMGLLDEIINETHIGDTKRLREIIAERRSVKQASMPAVGHTTAINRASAYFDESARWGELIRGIDYYDFLCELDDNFDDHSENLVEVLTWLIGVIFDKSRLIINVISDDEGYKVFEREAPALINSLRDEQAGKKPEGDMLCEYERWVSNSRPSGSATAGEGPEPDIKNPSIGKNEGLTIAGNVQYVARAGDFRSSGVAFHGSFKVLKTILSYEYLWNEVRVKGGAYGVMCGFSHVGVGYMVSYRDPNLTSTNDIFESVSGYLRELELTDEETVKFIIGTIRAMDAPLTPRALGLRSYDHYMSGVTDERIQTTRDEVLATTVEDLRRSADMVDAILAPGYICVVGNEDTIKKCSDMFDSVRPLV